MADIDIGQITEALNDKTDRDMRNVDTTAKADAVIDYQEPTADNGYTWYRKYASGWVEQGGQYSAEVITLPITMADTNYYVNAISINNLNYYMRVVSRNTTTLSIQTSSSTWHTYIWQVSGMAAN